MGNHKRIQYAAVLWVLSISAMLAASGFPSYVEHLDPAFRDLGCQGCHASGTPNSVVLEAKQITAAQAPTIDGVPDPVWAEAQPIRVNLTGGFDPTAAEGEPGWSFEGKPLPWGTGNMTTATMRALFDGTDAGAHLYVQVEWLDASQSTNRQPWFYDAALGSWAQADAGLFAEDKVAIFWEIDEVTGFDLGGCLITCHVTSPNRTEVRKYTTEPGDILDIWTFRAARLNGAHQVDDGYMDYEVVSRAIHNDAQDNSSLGYKNNRQSLNNGTSNVNVPLYWIPGRSNYDWILLSEIESGLAKRITAVDPSNDLTDQDGTPVPRTAVMPSIYTSATDGDRGNVEAFATYSTGRWLLEASRTLQTTITVNNTTQLSPHDVQFVDLSQSYHFAMAVFDNVGDGHMWHPGPYRLQFGESPTPVPSNLDVWGTSVAAGAFLVSGVALMTLAYAARKEGRRPTPKETAAPPAEETKGGGH